MRVRLWAMSLAALLIGFAATTLSAEVVRIDVTSRADVVGGQPFGAAGPYEKLIGRIYFAVDPRRSSDHDDIAGNDFVLVYVHAAAETDAIAAVPHASSLGRFERGQRRRWNGRS